MNSAISIAALIALNATSAQAGCYQVRDEAAARYCRGISADEIIHLRDVRRAQIAARLETIPGDLTQANAEYSSALGEYNEKNRQNGILSGRLEEIGKSLTITEETISSLSELRKGIDSLRTLPENAVPVLISSLRGFLTDHEESLDGEIARQIDESAKAPAAERLAYELSIAALLEMKVLRQEYAGKLEELLRNPLEHDSLDSDISPFARVLFTAMLSAEVANNQALGTLAFLESTASNLLAKLEARKELQNEELWQLSQKQKESDSALTAAESRSNQTRQKVASLNQEKDALIAERDAIPGRIQHLVWMQETGCGRATEKTVCAPDSPPKEPHDWGHGNRNKNAFSKWSAR